MIGSLARCLWPGSATKGEVAAAGDGGVRVKPALDVELYRQAYRTRRERAKEVARQHAMRMAASSDGGVSAGLRAARAEGRMQLIEPQCILGPAELCELLRETVVDCANGDGVACLAVAQYLQDTPPRPLVALSYLLFACQEGEQEGCARMAVVKDKARPEGPCDDDVFRCAWWSYIRKDEVMLDQVCALGVADACAHLEYANQGDPARARTYLEIACQLGNPMTCRELARRLTPGCRPSNDDGPCYRPDPAEAEAARTIACEAGFC